MIAAQWRLAVSATLIAVLAACGGGGGQIEPFRPTRLLSFGDEASVITPAGLKYSVNDFKRGTDGAITAPETLDCTSRPIWTQSLASQFGLVIANCNPNNATVSSALYAQVGAKVADVRAQIDQHLASGTVGPKDLITILVGQNDILELYRQYPTLSEDQIKAELTTRGQALADQVNRLANANGRILVATTTNPGETPFGLAEKAANTDTDRAALLGRLNESFNIAMRLRLINDGRLIGLVLSDEAITQAVRFPSATGFVNVTAAVCNVPLPNCTANTLVTDGNASTWLWADNLQLGPSGQSRLASAALSRAVNNPF